MQRRDFLRRSVSAAIGSGALFGALGQMQLVGATQRAQSLGKGAADFRALVCVFLQGGNDCFNMIVPRDTTTHGVYAASRGNALVIPRTTAAALPLNPAAAIAGGGDYGLHPGMQGLQQLFNSGQCAVVGNVGPLSYPINKTEFENGSVPTPANLFSHSDQELVWQTAWPESSDKTGWAGRAVDVFLAANPTPAISPCISLNGANVLQVGQNVQPYFMGVDGTESVDFIEGEWSQQRRATFEALRALAAQDGAHLFERQYAGVMQRALDNHALVSTALAAAPALTTAFPDSWLGRQLAMVARLIAVREALGLGRQVFYVTQGGYDTHDTQLTQQAELLPELSAALRAFYDATLELGVQNDVVSFTASDFGRTVSVNGDGTDHGWGGHHFVIGGAVQGQRFYGTMPDLHAQGPQDAGWGQIIPDTAVDQYAATLARWFGVSDSNVRSIVTPNLDRFGAGSPYLGFLPG